MKEIKDLGIAMSCYGDPIKLLELSKRAERAHFNRVWFIEVQDIDAFAMCAAVATVTKGIGIATGVTNSYLRLPTTIAMSAATVSLISNHRFALGIGSGSPPMGYVHAIRKDRPLLRFEETLKIVNGLLTGARLDFSGKLFRAEGFELGLKVGPRPPVYAAAMGPKAIALASRLADGVVIMLPTLEHITRSMDTINGVLKTRGISRRDFRTVGYFLTVYSEDHEEALKRARMAIVEYSSYPAFRNNFIRLGFKREIDDVDRALRISPEEAIRAIPVRMVDELIFYGSSDDIIKRARSFVQAGIDEPVLYPYMVGPNDYPSTIEGIMGIG